MVRKPDAGPRRWIAVTLLGLPCALQACSGPTAPPPPPTGGAELHLSFEDFEREVAPRLTQHGCDAGGDCHGGGIRGSLALSPLEAKDVRFDFDQVRLQVWAHAPASSPILTEPLAVEAGGTAHATKPFATTGDPDYQAIRAWVEAGVQR